jgi:hypothetical protein
MNGMAGLKEFPQPVQKEEIEIFDYHLSWRGVRIPYCPCVRFNAIIVPLITWRIHQLLTHIICVSLLLYRLLSSWLYTVLPICNNHHQQWSLYKSTLIHNQNSFILYISYTTCIHICQHRLNS